MRLCVTDVTSLPQRVLRERGYNVYRNAYAGNESPNCWYGRHWSALISRHSQLQEGYEGTTDDTRANEDCTIDEPVFIAGYQGEAEV